MGIIRARQPSLTRITQVNRNGPTVVVPNRRHVGSVRPPFYILNETFDASNVPVFRDDFNRADPAPWVSNSGAVLSINAGTLDVENSAASSGRAVYALTTKTDIWYQITEDFIKNTINGQVLYGTTEGGSEIGFEALTSSGTFSQTFQAVGTTTYVSLLTNSATIADSTNWDNVIIEEVPALDGADTSNVFVDVAAGEVTLTKDDAVSEGYITWAITTAIGSDYILSLTDVSGSTLPSTQLRAGTTPAGFDNTFITLSSGDTASFTATATTTYVSVRFDPSAIAGSAVSFSSITVQESVLENPTFDTDLANWTETGIPGEWGWSSGGAKYTGAVGNELRQALTFNQGERWIIDIEVDSIVAGTLTLAIGGAGETRVFAADEIAEVVINAGNTTVPDIRLIPSTNFDGRVNYCIPRRANI